ncbi:M20 aminoacylase family protein [Cucumibacter marinus]|uniref:M20 aminoacylase family protein n=1 Tax=Cucumibacter marinus TaxID=1121252 RepID=UPI0004087D35|nr:M20 aminoacylase family protein [Cucumibacter marinus]
MNADAERQGDEAGTVQFFAERQGKYVDWRHHLHRNPEIGFEEHDTARFIVERLTDMGLVPVTGLAGTGVVATIKGQGQGPVIGLRADMDALPIVEQADHDHLSQRPGVTHACGHDGHMTMLLAAAEYLSETRDFPGEVHVIFQPAEEAKGGAKQMVAEGLFDRFPCEAVFGLHNWPGLDLGTFAVKPGAVMAAMDLFSITITGTGAHAALPHEGTDTIVASGNLIGAIQSIASRSVNALDPVVISLTQVHGGDALNALPGKVTLKGTVRALSEGARALVRRRLEEVISGTASAHEVKASLDFDPLYPVTMNDAAAARLSADVAGDLWGSGNVITDYQPSMASEDFAFMLGVKQGSYAWIGNGRETPLHNPSFDFNDDLIPLGARYWVALAQNYAGLTGNNP